MPVYMKSTEQLRPSTLFTASCIALIFTSLTFAFRASLEGVWGHQFTLTKEEKQKAKTAGKPSPSLQKFVTPETKNGKTYSVETIREKHKVAYKPWTDELDTKLTTMYCEGVSISEMAKLSGRTKGAIIARIKKLELAEIYG